MSEAVRCCDICGLELDGKTVPFTIHVEGEDGEGFSGETVDARAHRECHEFWYEIMSDFCEGYIHGNEDEWADDISAVSAELNRMHADDRKAIVGYLDWYRARPDARPVA